MDEGQNPEIAAFQPRHIYQPERTKWGHTNPAHDRGSNRILTLIHDLMPTREDWLAARKGVLISTGISAVLASMAIGYFITSNQPSTVTNRTQLKNLSNTITAVVHPRPDTSKITLPVEQSTNRNDFTSFLLSPIHSPDEKRIIQLAPAIVSAEMNYTQKQIDQETSSFLAPQGEALLRYANAQKWNSRIEAAVNNPKIGLKESEKEFMKKILRLLIAAESGGDEKASSNDNAYGLCQLKDQAIQQAAEYLGLTEYNPKEPGTNILLALAYLQILQRSQSSWGLVFAEYNLGPGIMIGSQRAYLNENREANKINPDTQERDFDTLGINGKDHTATWVYGIYYNTTLSRLKESTAVQGYLNKHNIAKEEFGQLFYRIGALAKAWGYTN